MKHAIRIFSPTFRKKAGMALVVCLAMIVLLAAVVLAFFARATSNRLTEGSRSNQVEAGQLAQSAAAYVLSRFLQETIPPLSTTNTLPGRALPPPLASDPNFANLIRRSVAPDEDPNASTHNTATPAKNGRAVDAARWNAPMLLSGGGYAGAADLPHWIYLNRDGSVTNVASTNAVGRFAYNAYDVGGLLDVNVAGYPSSVSGTSTNMQALKGTLAGADLALVGVDADAFVREWRNAASAASPATYVDAVTNAAAKGFLEAASGDHRITSRQDLIKLAKTGGFGLTTNALPYLTDFTRELDRPSLDFNGLTNMTKRFALSDFGNWTNAAVTLTYENTGSKLLTPTISTNTPTFFQVLRAGISYTNHLERLGPLGVFSHESWPTNHDLKALALGANIIDQFREGSLPTRVGFDGLWVVGKKPLPMVNQVFVVYKVEVATTNLYVSVIPQLRAFADSEIPIFISGELESGSITVDGMVTPLPPRSVKRSLPGRAGLSVLTNGSAIPAYSGLISFKVPLTNAAPTNLAINLEKLAVDIEGEGGTYSSFGSNANSFFGPPISAELNIHFSTTNTVTSDALNGLVIYTLDPRTIRGAGTTNTIAGVSALGAGLPQSSIPHYDDGITDTIPAMPSSRIFSVGELGRVFRESPWRTIDFVSADSVDKALLDAFSTYDTPPDAAGLPVRAGVINLNTRQPRVLAALLSGAATNAAHSGLLSSDHAMTIAEQFVAATATIPLTNRSQLVDFVADNTLTIGAGGTKSGRETAIRALAEVGQTRTWNLMIDVIAQTGTFSATSDEGDFQVQGERRLWIHTAIDRPTRKVIAEKIEEIPE